MKTGFARLAAVCRLTFWISVGLMSATARSAEQLPSSGGGDAATRMDVPYKVAVSPSGRYVAIAYRVGVSQKTMMSAGVSPSAAAAAATRLSVLDLKESKASSFRFGAQNVAFSFSEDSRLLLGLAVQRRYVGERQASPVISRFGIRTANDAPELVPDGEALENLIGRHQVHAVSDAFRTQERAFLGHSGSMSGDGKVIAFRNCVYSGNTKAQLWCGDPQAWLAVDGTGARVASSKGSVHRASDGAVLWTSRTAARRENIPVLSADSGMVAWVPINYQTGWEMLTDRSKPISPGVVLVDSLSDGAEVARVEDPNIFSAAFSARSDLFLLNRYSTNGSVTYLDLKTKRRGSIEDVGAGFLNSTEILSGSGTERVVVSASSNGDVLISRFDRPIVGTILVDGNAFIAYLPDGRFHTNNAAYSDSVAIAVGGREFSFSQLWDVFYDPTVVSMLTGSPSDEEPRMTALLQSFLGNLPPQVSVGDGLPKVVAARKVRVPYSIKPDVGGISEVRVFQNGKLVQSDGVYRDAVGRTFVPLGSGSAEAARHAAARNATAFSDAPGGGSAAGASSALRDRVVLRVVPEKLCNPCRGEVEIDVIPGEENTVTVVAFNRDNTIQSLPASVTFKSTLPRVEPTLWVLSVGVNEFKKHGARQIGSLVNARKDAHDFACAYAGEAQVRRQQLDCGEPGQAKTLFKPENIRVVDVLLDERATKAGILGALQQIAEVAKPGDTFVWFVASHGMMEANSLFGVVAHDTECLNSTCTEVRGHITSNEILEASKKIKAMKQLLVLDTCHSGGLDHKLSGLYDARVSQLARNMGLHLYASAQATEAAQDGKPGTNGAFTAQLLKGIRGAAPKRLDGQITMITLGEYAKRETVIATSTPAAAGQPERVAQTPVIQHFGLDAGLVRPGP